MGQEDPDPLAILEGTNETFDFIRTIQDTGVSAALNTATRLFKQADVPMPLIELALIEEPKRGREEQTQIDNERFGREALKSIRDQTAASSQFTQIAMLKGQWRGKPGAVIEDPITGIKLPRAGVERIKRIENFLNRALTILPTITRDMAPLYAEALFRGYDLQGPILRDLRAAEPHRKFWTRVVRGFTPPDLPIEEWRKLKPNADYVFLTRFNAMGEFNALMAASLEESFNIPGIDDPPMELLMFAKEVGDLLAAHGDPDNWEPETLNQLDLTSITKLKQLRSQFIELLLARLGDSFERAAVDISATTIPIVDAFYPLTLSEAQLVSLGILPGRLDFASFLEIKNALGPGQAMKALNQTRGILGLPEAEFPTVGLTDVLRFVITSGEDPVLLRKILPVFRDVDDRIIEVGFPFKITKRLETEMLGRGIPITVVEIRDLLSNMRVASGAIDPVDFLTALKLRTVLGAKDSFDMGIPVPWLALWFLPLPKLKALSPLLALTQLGAKPSPNDKVKRLVEWLLRTGGRRAAGGLRSFPVRTASRDFFRVIDELLTPIRNRAAEKGTLQVFSEKVQFQHFTALHHQARNASTLDELAAVAKKTATLYRQGMIEKRHLATIGDDLFAAVDAGVGAELYTWTGAANIVFGTFQTAGRRATFIKATEIFAAFKANPIRAAIIESVPFLKEKTTDAALSIRTFLETLEGIEARATGQAVDFGARLPKSFRAKWSQVESEKLAFLANPTLQGAKRLEFRWATLRKRIIEAAESAEATTLGQMQRLGIKPTKDQIVRIAAARDLFIRDFSASALEAEAAITSMVKAIERQAAKPLSIEDDFITDEAARRVRKISEEHAGGGAIKRESQELIRTIRGPKNPGTRQAPTTNPAVAISEVIVEKIGVGAEGSFAFQMEKSAERLATRVDALIKELNRVVPPKKVPFSKAVLDQIEDRFLSIAEQAKTAAQVAERALPTVPTGFALGQAELARSPIQMANILKAARAEPLRATIRQEILGVQQRLSRVVTRLDELAATSLTGASREEFATATSQIVTLNTQVATLVRRAPRFGTIRVPFPEEGALETGAVEIGRLLAILERDPRNLGAIQRLAAEMEAAKTASNVLARRLQAVILKATPAQKRIVSSRSAAVTTESEEMVRLMEEAFRRALARSEHGIITPQQFATLKKMQAEITDAVADGVKQGLVGRLNVATGAIGRADFATIPFLSRLLVRWRKAGGVRRVAANVMDTVGTTFRLTVGLGIALLPLYAIYNVYEFLEGWGPSMVGEAAGVDWPGWGNVSTKRVRGFLMSMKPARDAVLQALMYKNVDEARRALRVYEANLRVLETMIGINRDALKLTNWENNVVFAFRNEESLAKSYRAAIRTLGGDRFLEEEEFKERANAPAPLFRLVRIRLLIEENKVTLNETEQKAFDEGTLTNSAALRILERGQDPLIENVDGKKGIIPKWQAPRLPLEMTPRDVQGRDRPTGGKVPDQKSPGVFGTTRAPIT